MFLHVNELLSDLSLKQIISGQYVSTNHTASTYIEVEVIGIPVDCVKHKTKVVSRNALNPIWNDLFSFQVSQQLQNSITAKATQLMMWWSDVIL